MTPPQTIDARDPLLCDFEMSLRAVFHPMGFSVDLTTNSAEVLVCAEESWGLFRQVFDHPAIQLRIGIREGVSGKVPPIPVCRSQQNLVALVADFSNFSVYDLTRGFGFSWLTQAAVADHAYFRYHFLEAMTLTILMARYLTPVHAACVALAGRGVLLCGNSGAGKSSLAYACARRGWTYISDDSSSIVRTGSDRMVVGNPHYIRLRPSAARLFPELGRHPLTRRINGETAIELATRTLGTIATAPKSAVDRVVFLNRQATGPASVSRFSPERALQQFEDVICYGEESVRDAQRQSLRKVLDQGVFQLSYSDLDSATDRLEGILHAED